MILYAGDGKTNGAASYLLGVLEHHQFTYTHLASDQSFSQDLVNSDLNVLVLSDYPSNQISQEVQETLVERVRDGMGLIMLGGWESYHGLGGNWDRSHLAQVLPVSISSQDDRINCWQPALVRKVADHSVLQDLPWNLPPTIGGFNRFVSKESSATPDGIGNDPVVGKSLVKDSLAHDTQIKDVRTLLVVDQFDVVTQDFDQPTSNKYTLRNTDPLLVVGTYGLGTTLAFASDVAPHWIGGTVDWGDRRVVSQARGAQQVEIGNWYAQFFAGLVQIAGGR